MSDKDVLEVGDIVKVKRSLMMSAYITNPLGTPLDGRIGEIEAVKQVNGVIIYEVRLWWYGAHFHLQRSQLEYLPGSREDWRDEAMKHESLDSHFIRPPQNMSDGDPLA